MSIKNEELKRCAETHAEQAALGQWLSKYPDNMTYDDILQALCDNEIPKDEKGNDLIIVWEVAEDYPAQQVTEFIDGTYQQILRAIEHVIGDIY